MTFAVLVKDGQGQFLQAGAVKTAISKADQAYWLSALKIEADAVLGSGQVPQK